MFAGGLAGAGARDQPEDNEEDNEQDEEEEPNRAEEDDFLNGLGVVKDGDGFADSEDAELRRAVPGDGVEALGFGEDGEGGGVFFVGVNFLIALPAAIATIVLLLIFGRPETVTDLGNLEYDIIKVVPYILVLVLALAGINVFFCLTIGIFSAGLVGFLTGSMTIPGFAQAIYNGFISMNETFFLSLFCGGMAEMVTHNGGIEWLVQSLGKMMKGNKSSQIGIAALVSLADCAVANNTIAIILSGPMAKKMAKVHKVDPRRTASLLDVFSCVFQGIIPYGAQLLSASSLTAAYGVAISTVEIIPNIWYCWILAVVALASIFIPFADGVTRKDPWNYEYDCAESGVEAKKAMLKAESGHPETEL